MDFFLNFTPEVPRKRLHYNQPALLTGSCFSDHISGLLQHRGIDVVSQPFGVVFNPVSITQQLVRLVQNPVFTDADIVMYNDLWHSWLHHSRFSAPERDTVLKQMNDAAAKASSVLAQKNSWIGITLGSAHVYELVHNPGYIVANCHKYPAAHFNKRMLSVEEVVAQMEQLFHLLPHAQFVFTVSPVRHVRDGLMENNRSKAVLLLALHELCVRYPERAYYFPAYEMVNDQLRDYRFFEADMVHPNQQAVRFVWEQFISCCFDAQSNLYLKEQEQLLALKNHRVMHEGTPAHKKLLAQIAAKEEAIKQKFPHLPR